MTPDERDERIRKGLRFLKDIGPIIISAKLCDDNTVDIYWNPVFIYYRDIFIKLGIMQELDEIEFACKVLEKASTVEVEE